MATQIVLYSSGTIDCYDDVSVSLNYNIADIREPDKRNSNYSKTITIPGTKNNNKLFSHYFEVDIYGGFNPNVKAPCALTVDTVPVMEGHLQLLKVNILDKNNIEYEVAVFGLVANIFAKLGTDELTELDFSAYNHVYNATNIVNSWTAPYGYGYVYPMIDYGYNNSSLYNVNHFYPALYLKEYIDKIFTYAGFTYTSSFLTSDFFRRLIIPFNAEKFKLTDTQVESTKFRSSISADVLLNTWTNTFFTIPFDDESSGDNFDNGNNYTNTGSAGGNTGYLFTAPANGTYNFRAKINFKLKATITCGSSATQSGPLFPGLRIIKQTPAGVSTLIGSHYANEMFAGTVTTGAFTGQITREAAVDGVVLNAGDKVFCSVEVLRPNQFVFTNTTCSNVEAGRAEFYLLSGGYFFNDVYNAQFVNGQTASLNSAIPENIKMVDLLTSTIKAFNLFVDVDKANPNNLLIEPRDDFYSSGTTLNWTQKLDLSQNLEIIPMGALEAREYLFSYDEDNDYWNKKYKDKYKESYGRRLVRINNEFLNETKEVKVIFAPTPLVQINDRIIPQIIDDPAKTATSARKSKVRLLYWAGLKTMGSAAWGLDDGTSVSLKTQVPYAGHLDDPYSPTLDLNFGIPKQVYYKATQSTGEVIYTNNNLYNKYWSKYMNEITHKDSKIVVGWFNLKIYDILSLDFRDKFFIDGHLLRLNKIYDYDPTAIDKLTKCEFINIKDGETFVPTEGAISGGGSTFIGADSEQLPMDSSDGVPGGYTFYGREGRVIGQRNTIGDRCESITIVGDDNSIHGNCNNISLLNSSGNIIAGGMKQVTLINTSGVTVTESNVVYVSNQKYSSTPGGYSETFFYTSGTITAAEVDQLDITGKRVLGPIPNHCYDIVGGFMWSNAGVAYSLLDFIALRTEDSTYDTPTFADRVNLSFPPELITEASARHFRGATVRYMGGLTAPAVPGHSPPNTGMEIKALASITGAGNKTLYYHITYRLISV